MTLVFVSYSPEAIYFANRVKEKLIHLGFEVFKESSNKEKMEWDRIVDMNMLKCDIFLVILTPASLESKEVEKQVIYALDNKKLILPCIYRKLVGKNQVKWGLNKIQCIEFNDKDELVRELDAKLTHKEIKLLNEYGDDSKTLSATPTPAPVISRPAHSEKQSRAPAPTPSPTPKSTSAPAQTPVISRPAHSEKQSRAPAPTPSPTPKSTSAPAQTPVISRLAHSEKQSRAPAPTPATHKGLNLKIIIPIVGVVAAISVIVLVYSGLPSTDRSTPTELTPTDVQTPLDYIREWHSSQPTSIAISTSSNVYTYGSNGVVVTDSNGNFITSWPSPSKPASFSDRRQGSIAVDSSDNVYVADAGNNRVQKFDSNGNFITMWGSRGSSEGQFESPRRIAVDSSDNVYVADAGNNRVQKFDSNGKFITVWILESTDEELGLLSGIAVDSSDNVYVAETERSIQKFDTSGKFIGMWNYLQEGERRDKYPDPIIGIAIDSSDDVYVADSEMDRIQRFDSNGVLKSSWGSEGEGAGEFKAPQGIAFDSLGNMYIADSWNARVQVFSQ